MNKKGFTLIELVMIIVILGILAAVAIPRYVDMAETARDAVIDGALGGIGGQLAMTLAQDKAYPPAANFATSVLGRMTINGWSYTTPVIAAPNATFSIVTGTTPVSGTDRYAQVIYNDSTFAITMGAKTDY